MQVFKLLELVNDSIESLDIRIKNVTVSKYKDLNIVRFNTQEILLWKGSKFEPSATAVTLHFKRDYNHNTTVNTYYVQFILTSLELHLIAKNPTGSGYDALGRTTIEYFNHAGDYYKLFLNQEELDEFLFEKNL